jgi:hypothetical protein
MKSELLILALAGTTFTGLATAAETVKIAYAYTSSVSSYYGGDDNTRSKINSKHSTTTTLHSNSATGVTFVKGPSYKATAYTVTNITSGDVLRNLRNHNGLQGARDTRDSSSSDIMQLVCDWTNSGTLGVAETPGWFSALRKQALGGTSSLATIASGHEIGHNMNALHGVAHCLTVPQKKTVMGSAEVSCTSYSIINYFSSSSRTYYFGNNGAAPLGDRTHNNRERVISQAPTTARYRN